MQEPSKFCARCNGQNQMSAAFCYSCGAHFPPMPVIEKQPKKQNGIALLIICGATVFVCAVSILIARLGSDKTTPSTGATYTSSPAPPRAIWTTPAPTPRPPSRASDYSSTSSGAERMVLNNSQVTVYVECTNREWKQYKFRFIIKKPGSPLLTPILRQAGNPRAYSVVVNGVDTGDGDLAFSPNIAAFDRNGEMITADFNTRPLNGNEALGRAYYSLIAKYERGD